MENLKCQKCKNAVICKYKDNMDKVEETFPFIASITCKFYEAPVKSEPAAKKEKPVKAEKPVKEATKVETIEEFPEINPPVLKANDARLIKNKLLEASKPKSISEEENDKPLTKEEKEAQFLALPIEQLHIRSATLKKLNKLGVTTIKDVYSIKPEDLDKQDINDINQQLTLFNKKPIKF